MEENTQTARQRKADHIELAFQSQLDYNDNRFNYEPMLSGHPQSGSLPETEIAGKVLKAPIWISSMTGGAEKAARINENLARVAEKFGLGMGLGSCRPLLTQKQDFADFDVRKFMPNQPLFANLGIAQIEELVDNNKTSVIEELVKKLEADGLIVHINPLQEWMQPEGDHIHSSPLETIKRVLDTTQIPIIIKEVGQGFGHKSISALLKLPIEALDFGAHGGTNFSLLEMLRADELAKEVYEPVAHIGHGADEMVAEVNEAIEKNAFPIHCKKIIVSGGIKNFLDGYYYTQLLSMPAIYAQASAFLKHAMGGYEELEKYTALQVRGLEMAHALLEVKK